MLPTLVVITLDRFTAAGASTVKIRSSVFLV
jgi:hypothetical protein